MSNRGLGLATCISRWLLPVIVLIVATELGTTGCRRGDDPAVVQARAALTMAENDARTAHSAQQAAESELARAQAAVAAADQEPQLVQARAELQRIGATQERLRAERNQWAADNRTDSGGRYLRWAELPRIDDAMMRQGGQIVTQRNLVGRLEEPLRNAQRVAQHADAAVTRARAEAQVKDAVVERARQTLQATIEAAGR